MPLWQHAAVVRFVFAFAVTAALLASWVAYIYVADSPGAPLASIAGALFIAKWLSLPSFLGGFLLGRPWAALLFVFWTTAALLPQRCVVAPSSRTAPA